MSFPVGIGLVPPTALLSTLLAVLLLAAPLLAVLLTALLGLSLAALLLAVLLAALGALREELARFGVTGALLGDIVHPLAELRRVTPVRRALVCAAALFAGPTWLLAGGLLLWRDVASLAAALLARLLAALLSHQLTALLARYLTALLWELSLALTTPAVLLLVGLLLGLLGRLVHLALLGRLAHLALLGLSLAALLLAVLLAALLAAQLALLAALGALREELARFGVTGALLGDIVHPLAELRRVTPVRRALVCAAALFAGPAWLLTGGLLLRRDIALLGLLAALLSLLSTEVLLAHGFPPWDIPAVGTRTPGSRMPERA